MTDSLSVKDLMVPRDQYASIAADSTLAEAALVLREAQKLEQSIDPGRHRDRAILVLGQDGAVIGKLSMLNILRGLLPRYARVEGSRASSMAATRVGSARLMIDSQEKDAGLWNKPLSNLIAKASKVKVRELLRRIADGETVDMAASLDTALHQMVMGRFQSLLVTSDGEIVGILRLTDVYEAISKLLRAHHGGKVPNEE
jgi:CBS domain containing-hemolysin-like protein